MPGTVRYNPELQIIETVFQGESSLKTILELVDQAFDMAQVKILPSDFSRLPHLGKPDTQSVVDILKMLRCYENLGVRAKMQEALIIPESADAYKMIKFYETVLTNNGFTVQLFENYQDAVQWLRSDHFNKTVF